MTSRFRSNDESQDEYRTRNGSTTHRTSKLLKEECDDTVGQPHNQNPLMIRRRIREGGYLNGQAGGLFKYNYENWSCDRAGTSIGTLPTTIPDSEFEGYRTAALARTGITRPDLNIPRSIAELKDVPRMLKHAGDLLHKIARKPTKLSPAQEAASATLAYQFGWKPLIEDIKRTLKFYDIAQKRIRLVNRSVQSRNGTRTRAKLEQESSSSKSWVPIQTSGQMSYSGYETVSTSRTVWATVHWRPKAHIRNMGASERNRKAFRDAFGFNKRNIPLTVWKLLPWSWFIDWFANFSDTIEAINNRIDYTPRKGCIMIHTTSTRSFPGAVFTWSGGKKVTLSSYSNTAEVKSRFPVAAGSWGLPLPTMRLPFLDNFKLSVLGSLLIQRIYRKP